MLRKIKSIIRDRYFQPIIIQNRIQNSLAKGAVSSNTRILDSKYAPSWEFSCFSQNGEDGIIDYLVQNLKEQNKYFIEVGASNGIECNSAWLATCRKFSGLMIDGNANALSIAKRVNHNMGVEYLSWFVTKENIGKLKDHALFTDPDFFSLDIDGNDYYLVKTILEGGFRPKIIAVEYNSAFGTEKSLTIQYKSDFVHDSSNPKTYPYYGVSIQGWKNYFQSLGYQFITVDTNGVNAFFVDPQYFESNFLDGIQGLKFKENFYQRKKYRKPWEYQFSLMADREFFEIQ